MYELCLKKRVNRVWEMTGMHPLNKMCIWSFCSLFSFFTLFWVIEKARKLWMLNKSKTGFLFFDSETSANLYVTVERWSLLVVLESDHIILWSIGKKWTYSNIHNHFYSTYYVAGTLLSTLHLSTLLILMIPRRDRYWNQFSASKWKNPGSQIPCS